MRKILCFSVALSLLSGLTGGAPAQERPTQFETKADSGGFLVCMRDQRKSRQLPIQLETKTGKLDGTLDLPEGEERFPVVIVHVGSGPTDRDGNWPGVKLDYLKHLGRALAQRGIAVLRYDRRGIGKSAAAWPRKEEEFRFDMLVDDLVEWVKMLRKDRRFSWIGIMGHSQGSLVGILAAQKVKVDAFVSLAGIGRRTHEVLSEQYTKNLPAMYGVVRGNPLAQQAQRILNELAAGHIVADPPKELAVHGLRPSVQPFLISLFKYQPAAEIAKLTVPVLIVQGTSDERHKLNEAKLLAAANKNAELCVIEGMNHFLTTPLWQLVAGNTPFAPLAPGLIERISVFLDKTVGARR